MCFGRRVTPETPELPAETGFRRKYTVRESTSRFLLFSSSLVSVWPGAQPPVGSIPQRERMKREGSRRHDEEKSGRNREG